MVPRPAPSTRQRDPSVGSAAAVLDSALVEGYDESSYGEGMADVYDDWYAEVSDVPGTVALLVSLAGDGPVCELGIGTGRIALPLRAAGVEVHGVDASPAMVARLRAKPGGADIAVLVGDMAAALPGGPFTVVAATYNTFFNLTSAESQRRCLGLVHEALAPGGRFVVEAFVPAAGAASSSVTVRSMQADRVVLSVTRHDPVTQVAEGQFVELAHGEPVRLRPWRVRYLLPEELDAMAAAAGLVLERRTEGWRGEPFTADSPHHVSVYRREAGVACEVR